MMTEKDIRSPTFTFASDGTPIHGSMTLNENIEKSLPEMTVVHEFARQWAEQVGKFTAEEQGYFVWHLANREWVEGLEYGIDRYGQPTDDENQN